MLLKQHAVGEGRLRPGAATWRTRRSIRVVFDSGLYENMTLSTKPEVHNIVRCRQRRTEPRARVTCTENLLKYGHVVCEICERTDGQTNKQRHTDMTCLSQYFASL